ncbi:tol-pal system protein YbgF [Kaistia defluvii]|uniref:tol-pal system protein YbgF n=1 Tax=Kaistia defluvii TaxID=410841 RepID=UPI002257D026|nr:tol-pal system protein YbgF [Kaistia defluvii]MCX5517514.1 tol-pal system protein YbgF [Kaistia defluvii]
MTQRIPILTAVLFAAGLSFATTGPADAGLFDRLKRGPEEQVPPAGVGDGGFAPSQSTPNDGQASMRMDRIEQQMREMTGQIEQLTFQVRQLQEQLQRAQGGGGAETGAGKRSEAPPLRARVPSSAAANVPPAARGGDPIGQAIGSTDGEMEGSVPVGQGAPPRDLGQITLDPNAPIDLSQGSSAVPGAAPGTAPRSTGSARGDYDAAYSLVLKGDYDVAEASFQQFLRQYPGDPLAADAQYWLGESLYARQDYRGAADSFLSGYKKYPKSGKAPDMLLKLGMSLAGLKQREAACATYAEVLKQYPKSSNALVQRVKQEQASASC